MKRILCIALALFLLLTAIGCTEKPAPTPNEGDTQETDTKQTESNTEEISGDRQETDSLENYYPQIGTMVRVNFIDTQDPFPSLAETTRTFFEDALNTEKLSDVPSPETDEYLPIFRFESAEELDAFSSKYDGLLNLTRQSETAPTLASEVEKLGATFFETNSLLAVYVPSLSGSYRFYVRSLETASNTLTVCIAQKPLSGSNIPTADCVAYLALIPIENSALEEITAFDAVIRVPQSISVTDTKLTRVHYFERDSSSFPPQSSNFFSEAINADQIRYVGSPKTSIFRFDSLDELETFNETYRDVLKGGYPTSDSPSNMELATADLDEAFFQTHSLIAVYVVSPSGSFSYFVQDVSRDSTTLTIHVQQHPFPEDCAFTCDIDAQMALIPIEKSALAGITHYDAFVTFDY